MSLAAVMAGGRSSRMPFDKQTVMIDGKYIAVAIADRIAHLFDTVVIISNTPELYRECPYEVIPDMVESHGPISGFLTGLARAQDDTDDYVYFVACDMPFIEPEYIQYMRSFMDGEREVVATVNDGHIETFNAFYHKRLVGFVDELLKRRQYSLLRIYDCRKIYFVGEEEVKRYDKSGRMFVNINSIEDYEKYLGHK